MEEIISNKKSDALYRKEHWFAIKLKNQIYKRLPKVKKRIRDTRNQYYKEYYQKHREKILQRSHNWAQANKNKTRYYKKKYKAKIKFNITFNHGERIKRIVSEFINYCKDRYAEHTIRQYKMNLDRFLKYIDKPGIRCNEYFRKLYKENKKSFEHRNFGWQKEFYKPRFVGAIDRDLIMNYISYVNHDEINVKGVKLNQSEKETRLYPLKAFLLFCQRKGFIKKDLRKFVIVPSREKKVLKRTLTPEETARLLEVPGDKETVRIRDKALLELSYSGFRANEMLTLKLKHLDLDTNTVTILNTKGDKDRVVPMTREAIYWIKRWLNRRGEFVGNHEDPEYLFITKGVKPIIRRNFSAMLKKYAKKAKIPIDVSPHDLRRTTATHLVENGAPIRMIQALLGHATLKVTTKYLRLSNEKIKKEHKETHPSNRRNLYYGNLQR